MKKIKSVLNRLGTIKNRLSIPYAANIKTSYSRAGEDLILQEIFGERNGFFIDVGAYHPYRFSNTFLFYRKGWRGINIEPNREAIRYFKEVRPRDINLNLAIGEDRGYVDYYYIKGDYSMNTISNDFLSREVFTQEKRIEKKENVEMWRLEDVLNEYLAKGQKIDFINVDVEGTCLEVVKSNDWNTFRPKAIIIEDEIPIEKLYQSEIYNFLQEKGYRPIAYTIVTENIGNVFYLETA